MKTILANTISSLTARESENCRCDEMLLRCGFNTGNVCFVDALFSQLNNPDEIDSCNIADFEEWNGKVVFVLPASNWINENGWALHRVFLPLEDKDVKLAAVGIGIQGEITESASSIVSRLSHDTISALKILSEHSVSIGVRGEITAAVLEKLGIYNCRVIGCPSFYELFRQKKDECGMNFDQIMLDKVVCGITPETEEVHKVLELAYEAGNILIMQMMADHYAGGQEY